MCVCVGIHLLTDKRMKQSNSGVVMICEIMWQHTPKKEAGVFKKKMNQACCSFSCNGWIAGSEVPSSHACSFCVYSLGALYRNNQKPHCEIESHPSRQTCRKPANTLAWIGAMMGGARLKFELRLALSFAFMVECCGHEVGIGVATSRRKSGMNDLIARIVFYFLLASSISICTWHGYHMIYTYHLSYIYLFVCLLVGLFVFVCCLFVILFYTEKSTHYALQISHSELYIVLDFVVLLGTMVYHGTIHCIELHYTIQYYSQLNCMYIRNIYIYMYTHLYIHVS